MENEEWRDVDGLEGFYQVSYLGRIRSMDRVLISKRYSNKKVEGKIMKGYDNKGYLMAKLCKANVCKGMLIHRLVALAFIPNPENKPDVNHKNGIKTDNRVVNLEWSTESENTQHAHRIGLMPIRKGEKSGHVKLTDNQVLEIRSIKGKKLSDIALEYGVAKATVHAIITRRNWDHI